MSKDIDLENIQLIAWDELEPLVAKKDARAAQLLADLHAELPLYLYKVRYRYGDMPIKNGSLHLPLSKKPQLVSIKDRAVPKKLREDLNYCQVPLSFSLNKSCEIFIAAESGAVPLHIIQPGQFYGLYSALNPSSWKDDTLKPIWEIAVGGYSVFLLPKVGSNLPHKRLLKAYQLRQPPPKSLEEQSSLFASISRSPHNTDVWYSDILMFPKNVLLGRTDSLAWQRFRSYLLELIWLESQHLREKSSYSLLWQAFSSTTFQENIKSKGYLIETLKHLVFMASGSRPGFRIATNEDSLPLAAIERAYTDVYRLKYAPLVMEPCLFSSHKACADIYYSLSYPTLLQYAPQQGYIYSNLAELRDVKCLMGKLQNSVINDSHYLAHILRQVDFQYFHHDYDDLGEIESADAIPLSDKVLAKKIKRFPESARAFSVSSTFFRGCVKVKRR